MLPGLYDIPGLSHFRVRTVPSTNIVPFDAYRGAAVPEAALCPSNALVDALRARKLDMTARRPLPPARISSSRKRCR